jgi:hypothetical protein
MGAAGHNSSLDARPPVARNPFCVEYRDEHVNGPWMAGVVELGELICRGR